MVKSVNGQALVETAVVLPLLCLAAAVTFQMIASCHNAVLLQRLSYTSARDISAETKTVPVWLARNPLWGRGAAPRRRTSSAIPQPWRPFIAMPRVEAEGHIVTVDIRSVLLPTGGFGRGLAALTQQGAAEALIEPAVPGDE